MEFKKRGLSIVFALVAFSQAVSAEMIFKQPLQGLRSAPSSGSGGAPVTGETGGTETGGGSGSTDTTADANGNLAFSFNPDFNVVNTSEQHIFSVSASGIDSDAATVTLFAKSGAILVPVTMSKGSDTLGSNGDYSQPWSTGAFSLYSLPDGNIDLYVEVEDTDGNVATTPTSTILKDTTVEATVSLDPLSQAGDNHITLAEQAGDIYVTGSVVGEGENSSSVLIRLQGQDYNGSVTNGSFSVMVPGSAFANDSDLVMDWIVIMDDAAGNTFVSSESQSFSLEYQSR